MEVKQLTAVNAADGVNVHGNLYQPEGTAKALVLVLHGMAEHKERYQWFIGKLTDHGYAVLSTDERGHGESAEVKGYFGKQDGWLRNVEDQHELVRQAQDIVGHLPLIVFGHSMGTLVARSYLKRYEDEITAVALSGTPNNNKAVGTAIALCKIIKAVHGPHYRSSLLNALCFGAFNKRITDPRTDYDWLSYDEANVDRYIADPDCGYIFTVQGFQDMFEGMKDVYRPDGWQVKRPQLPIAFFSGSEDPCMGSLDGLKEAVDILNRQGYQQVSWKTYDGCRHEILNDVKKEQVAADIIAFMDQALG